MVTCKGVNSITRERMFRHIALLIGLVGISIGGMAWFLPVEKMFILLPMVTSFLLFMVFSIVLWWQIGGGLFGEIGFAYMGLAVAYTVFPALTFILLDLNFTSGWVWEKLSLLLPAPYDLGVHLWRHVLFIFGVGAGYLLFRGRRTSSLDSSDKPSVHDRPLILFLFVMIGLCIFTVNLLSAPVATYIDHYTRFDHLPWLALRFLYVCLIFKTGGYFVLLTFLFYRYKQRKWTILLVVLLLCLYEISYSFGSRIETLSILLAVFCLYHYLVRPITIKMGLTAFFAIAMLFSVVELFRSTGFNSSNAKDVLSREGGTPASEFGAVYFTSYHLYGERNQGTLPPREWPMFFNDIIAVIPFADHTRWHPQFWYARHYFPDAVVPPQTMGPIADSAIWGGGVDLLFRSLFNGALFAYFVRWFQRRKDKWWAMVIYIYLYATCVMVLKYSVLFQLMPLLKILLPTLITVVLVRRWLNYYSGRVVAG